MKALAVVPLIWAAVALVWFFPVGAEVADSQGALPKESLLDTACTTAYQVAVLGGVNPTACRLVALDDQGQNATVTVKVKIAGQGWFTVALAYQRSVWSQSGIYIKPV